jgi:hypothetical protein
MIANPASHPADNLGHLIRLMFDSSPRLLRGAAKRSAFG